MPSPTRLATTDTLRWHGLTDRGHVRPNNEDSFLCLQFDAQELRFLGKIGEASLEHDDYVFAVSDGMGGARNGEFASRITVEKITRLLPPAYKLSAQGLDAGFTDVLTELFTQIHRALTYLGQSYEECRGMGATLSLCWFTPEWMYYAHIGDSRIYYLPAAGAEIRQITEDDTYVGWLYRSGRLNEREARSHPARNALQKALGADHQFVDPQVGRLNYRKGDQFLLATDGLVDGLFNAQFLQMLRHPDPAEQKQTPAERLVKAALERAGRDNTTALVVEVI